MNAKPIAKTLDELKADVKYMTGVLEKICKVLEVKNIEREKEDLMTLKEVANLIKMDESTIVNKCNKGEMPFLKKGKGYKFRKSELMDWMQKNDTEMLGSIDEYVSRYLQENPLKGY
jgi:excisionase family DNA binding protein